MSIYLPQYHDKFVEVALCKRKKGYRPAQSSGGIVHLLFHVFFFNKACNRHYILRGGLW